MKQFNKMLKVFFFPILAFELLAGCSPNSGNGGSNGYPGTTPLMISEKITALRRTKTSGTVGPEWYYSVTYEVDFQIKTLTIAIEKGTSVDDPLLPSPGKKLLSDLQTQQVRRLISQVSVKGCESGAGPLGGGLDYFTLHTTSYEISDMNVYGSNCAGVTQPNSLQGNRSQGYDALTTYLESL